MTELIGQFGTRLIVRPTRVAYLIGARSSAGARAAIEEACTRWGGAAEPILNVLKGVGLDDWQRQLVKLAGVEGIVNVDLDETTVDVVAKQTGMTVTPLSKIDKRGEGRFTSHPAVLRHAGPTPMAAQASDDLWKVAALGIFRSAAFESETQRAEFPVIDAKSPIDAAIAQLQHATLADRTMAEFGCLSTSGAISPTPGLCIISGLNDIRACLWFWNMRALQPRRFTDAPIILLPRKLRDTDRRLREVLQKQLSRSEELSHDLLVEKLWCTPENARTVMGELGLTEEEGDVRCSTKWPPPAPRSAPFVYRTYNDLRTFVACERTYGEQSSERGAIYQPQTAFSLVSPVESRGGGGRATVVLANEYFRRLPKSKAVADFIWKHAVWEGDALKVRSRIQSAYGITLKVPTVAEAVTKTLSASTKSYELSDKGRIANRIPQIPGEHLDLDETAIACIGELATPRSKSLLKEIKNTGAQLTNDQLNELARDWGGRSGRRFAQGRHLPKDSRQRLEPLAKAGWAERGLVSVCDLCLERTFVHLKDSTFDATCPACGAKGRNYTGDPVPEIHYRLNALIDRAFDQGVIAHLFIAQQLLTEDPDSFFLLGIDVETRSGPAEVDLYGCFQGRVVVGEIKTSPADFTAEQVKRDVEVAASLNATYLIGSIHKIPDETKQMAGTTAAAAGLDHLHVDIRGVEATS